jgi:hypothetical protein
MSIQYILGNNATCMNLLWEYKKSMNSLSLLRKFWAVEP